MCNSFVQHEANVNYSSRIEDALELADIQYNRLDGTMKRDERTRAMDDLKYNPACEILLVSLKAGGVGLNLTAAQRVYLMDPYWCVPCFLSNLRLTPPLTLFSRNPAVENQAVDRIVSTGYCESCRSRGSNNIYFCPILASFGSDKACDDD